ncbi:hypothetical protein ACS0TY_019920 [Phlomoides rotata]
MATTSEAEVRVKHLGFVKVLAINAVFVVLKLYGYAKQKSGPLKSTVGKVERAVTDVVEPVYYEFKEVSSDILVFLDNKVDAASYIFDKHAPPIVKSVVSMMKKALDLVQLSKMEAISHAAKISKEIFDERTPPPIAKGLVSMVQKAKVEDPFAVAANISKEGALSIAKGVGSMVKKPSDLVQLEDPVATISHAAKTSDLVQETKVDEAPFAFISYASKISKKASNIFDIPIVKGVGSIVKKTSDLVQEGPVAAAISNAGKEASHIFDQGALSIAKGVGSMVKKTSDLVQEAPVAAISYAPSIAKNVVSMVKKASDLVKVPFAAISEMSKEFAVRQLVMLWYKANQDSFMHGILEIIIPIVAHLLEKYNKLVKYLIGKGWSSLFRYVPLVPLEEMEKTFKQVEAAVAATRRSNSD